jgi:hypothetical protein
LLRLRLALLRLRLALPLASIDGLIVGSAPLRIAQDLIGQPGLDEAGRCCSIVRVAIGMMLHGERPKRSFYGSGTRQPRDSQCLVMVVRVRFIAVVSPRLRGHTHSEEHKDGKQLPNLYATHECSWCNRCARDVARDSSAELG